MKPILLASSICCFLLLSLSVTPVRLPAQSAPAVVPVIAPAPVAAVRYRVIDTSTIPLASGKNAAESIEVMLNDMAAQGWRLVSISGSLFVLSSP